MASATLVGLFETNPVVRGFDDNDENDGVSEREDVVAIVRVVVMVVMVCVVVCVCVFVFVVLVLSECFRTTGTGRCLGHSPSCGRGPVVVVAEGRNRAKGSGEGDTTPPPRWGGFLVTRSREKRASSGSVGTVVRRRATTSSSRVDRVSRLGQGTTHARARPRRDPRTIEPGTKKKRPTHTHRRSERDRERQRTREREQGTNHFTHPPRAIRRIERNGRRRSGNTTTIEGG